MDFNFHKISSDWFGDEVFNVVFPKILSGAANQMAQVLHHKYNPRIAGGAQQAASAACDMVVVNCQSPFQVFLGGSANRASKSLFRQLDGVGLVRESVLL